MPRGPVGELVRVSQPPEAAPNNAAIHGPGPGARPAGACVVFRHTCQRGVNPVSQPLLDAVDHLCHQVEGDPEVRQAFFAARTPEEIVALTVEMGIFIGIDDFRALLTSGSTECWLVRGDDTNNPIAHLQTVFAIRRSEEGPCAQ